MACIYIPVQNSEEEVRVALDQLPRDATDILDILKAEQAPLDLWLIIAREYFKQGKIEQFIQILEEGSSPKIDEYYADVRYERIAILNALGAYYSYLGKIETKQREKEDFYRQATKHYNKASRIDVHEPSTWIGKGQLLLAKGDVEQAFNAFKIVLDDNRDNVAALLGQACVHFSRGKYSESLELYKRALQVYPQAPTVRVGIALCQYKLGRHEKAKQAFHRVLELDPENVEALVALGILDLQTNEAVGIRNGMEKMQRAFGIYPYCANSLNYLANHFFFTGQHFLVEQLTETALSVTMHGPTKAHSYYNLARSYHSKGDYEKAGMYYMASVKESNTPHEFVLPYYGLGQVQLKLGDWRSALANFEKVLEVQPENCETLKAVGHIYVQLDQNEKAQELYRKATKIDPRDPQAFLDLGELLISTDIGAALDAFKTAHNLMKRGNEEIPLDLLNNMGALYFERGELELAAEVFKEALGEGVWCNFLKSEREFISNNSNSEAKLILKNLVDMSLTSDSYKDAQLFQQLEEKGLSVELPWYKVSILFNLGRVLEQMHNTELASILYHLILFKYPEYTDAYLRLAAIMKARNNVQMTLEQIGHAIRLDEKCVDALLMRGDLELKNDDWLTAKQTFRMAKDLTGEKDFYAAVCLGNWNYFAANRNEKRAPKLETTHYEKAKELYMKVLQQQPANLYAANGAGMVFAERGQFDIAKELFTQVQEAASGSSDFQMPDVWINLAHVHFAQGSFTLAVKLYEKCLRKFYYNNDSQVLLYLARTHYEAEQWEDCRKTLLRAIHLAPSNYTLRFNMGVALQKYSASTISKTKKTEEFRIIVTELNNALRLFNLLSSSSTLHFHGFDEKKIGTHVEYLNHLLQQSDVHFEAIHQEEMQNMQRLEAEQKQALANEARKNAEELIRKQMEKRKQEDELKQVMQQEKHLELMKEQWRHSSKRKDRSHADYEEGGGRSERRRKKGSGKRRKRDKRSSQFESDEGEAEYKDRFDRGQREQQYQYEEEKPDVEDREDVSQGLLAAAGLEDSDVEDQDAATNMSRRKRVWSDSEEEEEPQPESPTDMQGSDRGAAAGDEE